MIDHLGLHTSPDLHDATVSFYVAALKPLGYSKKVSMFDGKVVGFGCEGSSALDFWIAVASGEKKPTSAHFAFRAPDNETVTQCYTAGLSAGGKDNGAPGLRPQYHANYYGAFLFDPLGNPMEFVCHGGAGATGQALPEETVRGIEGGSG